MDLKLPVPWLCGSRNTKHRREDHSQICLLGASILNRCRCSVFRSTFMQVHRIDRMFIRCCYIYLLQWALLQARSHNPALMEFQETSTSQVEYTSKSSNELAGHVVLLCPLVLMSSLTLKKFFEISMPSTPQFESLRKSWIWKYKTTMPATVARTARTDATWPGNAPFSWVCLIFRYTFQVLT